MEIIKNNYGILGVIIICVIVFYLANNNNFFGKIINFIYPCTQNPEASFPCYGQYDILAMIIAVIIAIICFVILVHRS